MAISDVKTAIATAINTALSIKCYKSIPSIIAELPCAYIVTGEGNYVVNIPMTKSERIFGIFLLFARAEALEDAQARLDAYLLPTGTASMKVAIEATVLSTYGDFLRVISDTGVVPIVHNDISYIGCRWRVSVLI